jgi:superfamily II DNA or RNA helicase
MSRSEIHVTLRNRVALFHQPYPTESVREYFRFRPPNYYWSPKFRLGMWDGWINLLKRNACSAGLFLEQRATIEKELGVRFIVHDERRAPAFLSDRRKVNADMRDYLEESLAEMIAASGTGGIVLNATGTGKTVLAAMYFAALKGNGCFIVDELTLLDQSRKELARVLGEPIGQVGGQQFIPRRITVATVQTMHLHRMDPRFQHWASALDTIIIDELHLALNRRNIETVAEISPRAVFGLTATLQLNKPHIRMRAAALVGPVIYHYSITQGVKERYLSAGLVVSLRMYRAGRNGTDYQNQYYEMITANVERNQCIADLARFAIQRGKHVIILVERVLHLRKLSRMLADIPHEIVWGGRTVESRVEIKQTFEDEGIRLILTNKVFKKGVNILRVDLIIDAAAMRSPDDCVQKFGRGVRMCQGKHGLIYIDMGDRNYDGVRKKDAEWNRFAVGTVRRCEAFQRISIPVVKWKWNGDAESILLEAERHLAKILRKGDTA